MKRYQRLYERTLKEVEKEARDYFYSAKDPKKARESVKMRRLENEWEKLSDGSYTFGDVLA